MPPSRGDLERMRRSGLDTARAAIARLDVPEHLIAALDSATNGGRDPYPQPGSMQESAYTAALLGALAAGLADDAPEGGWPAPHTADWAPVSLSGR